MSQLLLNVDGQQQVLTTDNFLEAFRAANHGSTPFDTAQALVNHYRRFLANDLDEAELRLMANEATAQFLAG